MRLPNLYGPQLGLFFVPLSGLSFPVAARIWVAASLLIFAGCIFLIWRSLAKPPLASGAVFLGAIAFPPLFHFFVRGQMSALVLACFTRRFLHSAHHPWLAGVALGFLIFKPQFLIAIPLVLAVVPSLEAVVRPRRIRRRAVVVRQNLFRSRSDAVPTSTRSGISRA